jgi:hypothetical protein
MTTTQEFLKEIKEKDIHTRQDREKYLGQELNKFIDSGGIMHDFGDSDSTPHLDLVYDFVRWYPSDMYEHLPTLRKYAGKCDTVCGFGTNDLTSTLGLLSGFPKHLITLDLNHPDDIFALTFEPFSPNRKENEEPMVIKLNLETVNKIAAENEIEFKFIQTNSLEFSFNSVDLLFIDSLHTYTQLTKELMLHSKKVKKYIILHDTEFYGEKGQDNKDDEGNYLCPHWETKGIGHAIAEFLENPYSGWVIDKHYTNCHGLTILKRPWIA